MQIKQHDNPDLFMVYMELLLKDFYLPSIQTYCCNTRPVQNIVMAINPYTVNVRPTVTRIPLAYLE